MKKIKLLLAVVAAMVGLSAQAQLTNGTVYWIQDTGTGQFISQGDNWSTRSVTKDVGGLGWEAVYISDGVYKLKNIMWNTVRGENKGLGSDLYVDNGSPAEFTLTASGDGYLINLNGEYLVNNGTENSLKEKPIGKTTDVEAASVWKFLTKTEYDAAIQAYKDGKAASYATSLSYSVNTVSELEALILDANQFITKDYTNSIKNPTLSDNGDNWTHGKVSQRDEGWNVGSGCAEFWNGCGSCTQTISNLPNGLYKVTFVGSYRPGNSEQANSLVSEKTSSPAFVYANDAKAEFLHWIDVPAKANGRGGITVANGYLNSFYTYVTDGTLALGVVADGFTDRQTWTTFGQFTLTYYTDQVSDEDAAALLASVPTGKMSDATQSTLNAAKSAFEANKTIANFNTLSEAIAKANISVAEYATIASGVIPTNVMTGWSKTTPSGDFHVNTWSAEGDSDGSDMTTPFMENWVSSGNQLGAGKVLYTFTDLNPDETYVVTARVRVFNEAGTGVTGASFFAGDNSKDLATFGADCTGDFANKGRFAVLSCAGTVAANGQLQFGVELADGSPINWVAIKDVIIAEGTGDVPTAIALNESNVTLITGSHTTLTATITPATADDKTIIWSSSDETVATVSGGYVVAHKAGTATITANAYAGNNTTATCMVTVADAAAPSYYSTTIAAGDYYIMNAATGTYLGGGNSWGTHGSVIEHGIPFTVAVDEGVYTMDSHTYNNANDHFFNGEWVDGGSTNLYITALTDGKFSISTADGSAFVTALAGSTVVSNTATDADSPLAQWYFLSKNDRDKMLKAATAQNPVDATYYVKQANPSRNLSAGALNLNAWSQYNVGGTQDNSNFAAQVYNAEVDNYQTIENIPNGTYKVSVQAFTSGKDVKFYANDQKVDVKANDSGVASCSGAAALFKQGLYRNEVTVTVTDRTLKIGFEGDCSDAKWLCYDDVTLYMTGYVPVTNIAAELDKDEIQIGQTAQITTTSTPAAGSFNAATSYSSSDESIATVDENGVVTGVAVGSATITVVANEMENNSTTVDITVTLVTPTAFALSETEVALDKENTTATLTIVPTPEGANTAATWVSSDETVAIVADGVVTAVLPGTATITATSTIDENVSAQATVTVSYPESEAPATYFVNDGATRTVYTLGENLIKNGSFEYPNPVYGWTTGTGSVNAMSTSNFNVPTTGAANGDQYLQAKESKGGADAKSINTSWPLEDGKTYVFGYKIKANKQCTTDLGYIGTSLSNTKGSENSNKKFETPAYGTEWQDVTYTFTNTDNYKFLVFNARWMANAQSFDNFYLCEAEYTLEGNVDYATAAIPSANIGTGAFQYSQDAIDAANALVQGTATVEDVEAAYEALTTLNEPTEETIYNIVAAEEGNTKYGNAVVITTGATSNNNPTGYGLNVNLTPNTNLNQAVTFTKKSGNNYYISFETAAGTTYLTTGSLNGSAAGWKTQQIQATTDAEKKCAFTIVASTVDNVFYIYNPEHKDYIDYQDGGSLYTDTNIDHKSFSLVETSKPSIEINTTKAGWGTVMLPFAAEIPSGVKVYSVSELSGQQLTLVQVNALEANKPYIIEGTWNETLTGDAQGVALTYTEGLLTGVYEDQDAPNGKYIMQKQDDLVGFFKVDYEDLEKRGLRKPQLKANRAYLTAPTADVNADVKAFYLSGTEDAIKSVFDAVANGDIYDLNGRKVQKMQKGNAYIVNGKTVVVK